MKLRTIALAASALTAVLVLAACSGTPSGNPTDMGGVPSDSASQFNDADVTFATGMIAHHEQAIEMADLLLDKEGVDERVIDLALDIKAAQQPEIDTMTSWLADWGQSTDSGMNGMNHGDGMMSDTDMSDLEAATGPEAARLFLEQMTQHHEGAIAMAQTELSTGQNLDALTLAQTIIDAQTAEIATMREILDTL
ncbi:MAG: DUF305 domain-containing protein [Microbacteriaceae bacterium]|jgi:uncharacterized protein (DUF305 family)|nr:DUF305 domain-containing protein [Microbacteriaceae bacterium]